LIWLDADTKIRELTNDRKSLDDFAADFLSPYNGSFVTYTYDLQDIVEILNRIAPYDWMKFFQERVYALHPIVPTDGITHGGYKLVYSDKIPSWLTRMEAAPGGGGADFSTSLGFSVGGGRGEPAAGTPSNSLGGVWWNSAAFNAGITSDMQIISVNGKAYTAAVLREAITEAERAKRPIELQFRRGEEYKSFSIPYYGGLRVPSLERVEGTPDRLDEILAPSKRALPAM
jgi:predicted metalloprotease with PDZ domain